MTKSLVGGMDTDNERAAIPLCRHSGLSGKGEHATSTWVSHIFDGGREKKKDFYTFSPHSVHTCTHSIPFFFLIQQQLRKHKEEGRRGISQSHEKEERRREIEGLKEEEEEEEEEEEGIASGWERVE